MLRECEKALKLVAFESIATWQTLNLALCKRRCANLTRSGAALPPPSTRLLPLQSATPTLWKGPQSKPSLAWRSLRKRTTAEISRRRFTVTDGSTAIAIGHALFSSADEHHETSIDQNVCRRLEAVIMGICECRIIDGISAFRTPVFALSGLEKLCSMKVVPQSSAPSAISQWAGHAFTSSIRRPYRKNSSW